MSPGARRPKPRSSQAFHRSRTPRWRLLLLLVAVASALLPLSRCLGERGERRPPVVPLVLILRSPEGRVLEGARVRFYPKSSPRRLAHETRTDASGKAVLPVEKADGDFYALIRAPDGTIAQSLVYGRDPAPMNLTLLPPSPLRGSVTDREGRPLPGALVHLRSGGFELPVLDTTLSRRDGSFVFSHVSALYEVLNLTARKDGFAEERLVWYRRNDDPPRLALAKQRLLRFRLLDEDGHPIEGIEGLVTAGGKGKARSDARGRISFAGLPLTKTCFVRFFHPTLTYRAPPGRKPGGKTRRVVFHRPRTLRARLLDAGGRPLRGYKVFHRHGPRAPVVTKTDRRGRFTLGDLPPGPIELRCLGPSGATGRALVRIPKDGDLNGVDLTMEP